VSQDAVSGERKCSEIRLRPALRPGPRWGSLHLDPLAGLKRAYFKEEGKAGRRSPNKILPLRYCILYDVVACVCQTAARDAEVERVGSMARRSPQESDWIRRGGLVGRACLADSALERNAGKPSSSHCVVASADRSHQRMNIRPTQLRRSLLYSVGRIRLIEMSRI